MTSMNIDFKSIKTEYEPEPFQDGIYNLRCLEAEEYTSNAGNKMIKALFKIDSLNKKVFVYFNIFSTNEKAKAIALKQLAQFVKYSGSGIETLTAPNALNGWSCDAFVKEEQGKNGYGPSLKVSYFVEGNTSSSAVDKSDMPF